MKESVRIPTSFGKSDYTKAVIKKLVFAFSICAFLAFPRAFSVRTILAAPDRIKKYSRPKAALHFLIRHRSADLLLNLGCLTDSVAQVVELRTADLTAADDLNLLYMRRVDREGLFYAYTVGDTADGERLADAASATRNNGSLKNLNSFAGALLDKVMNLDGITDVDLGYLCLELLAYKSLKLINS